MEPGLVRSGFPTQDVDGDEAPAEKGDLRVELSAEERRGLRAAGLTLLLLVAAVLTRTLVPGSPLRNDTGGYPPESPLFDSVVTLVFLAFFVPGLAYGVVAGVIRTGADVPLLMGRALKDLSGFIVLTFVLGQFIAFTWTNLGA